MIKRFTFALLSLIFVASPSVLHAQEGASLSFQVPSLQKSLHQTFSTDIWVDTGENSVGGVGVQLFFDPTFFIVENIETGSLFDDYPVAAFDQTQGKISISGIVGSPGKLYKGKGVFARVNWKTMRSGSSTIKFDYTNGSTTDSNVAVTFGSGDALSNVENIEIITSAIEYTPEPGATNIPLASVSPLVASAPTPSFFSRTVNKIKSLFGANDETEIKIDPYAPITKMPAKTDLFSSQPTGDASNTYTQNNYEFVIIFVGIIVFVIVIVLVVAMKLRKQRNDRLTSPVVSINPMMGAFSNQNTSTNPLTPIDNSQSKTTPPPPGPLH